MHALSVRKLGSIYAPNAGGTAGIQILVPKEYGQLVKINLFVASSGLFYAKKLARLQFLCLEVM